MKAKNNPALMNNLAEFMAITKLKKAMKKRGTAEALNIHRQLLNIQRMKKLIYPFIADKYNVSENYLSLLVNGHRTGFDTELVSKWIEKYKIDFNIKEEDNA